jgi:hypothetical protein
MNYLTCHHPSLTAERKGSALSQLTFKPSNKTEPRIFRGRGMSQKMYDAMRAMPTWNPDIPDDNLDDLAFAFGTFPIIDFADARNRGFDTTINTSKSLPNQGTLDKFRSNLELGPGEPFYLIRLLPAELYSNLSLPDPTPDVEVLKAELPSLENNDKDWQATLNWTRQNSFAKGPPTKGRSFSSFSQPFYDNPRRCRPHFGRLAVPSFKRTSPFQLSLTRAARRLLHFVH